MIDMQVNLMSELFVSQTYFYPCTFTFLSPGSNDSRHLQQMVLVESSAAFRARAAAMKIPDVEVTKLADQGVDSFAAYAFFVPYNPLAPDDVPLVAALTTVLGQAPSVVALGRFRRLQFESYTMVMADAKSRVERTDESIPRRMPGPERSARLEEQVGRLPGVDISQGNEPSHSLVDAVHQMMEDGMIKHVPVEKCTCRSQELQGVKSDATTANLGSDFLVRQALLRRALAFDQAQVITFRTHETWSNMLFECMHRVPPPGYTHTTLNQALSADRELFVLMGERCRNGISQIADGARPADECMVNLMDNAKIQFLLLPLPTGSNRQVNKRPWEPSSASTVSPSAEGGGKGSQRKGKGTKGKGKGKTGKQGKGKGNMPAGLAGCVNLVNGHRPCFSYNLEGCEFAGPGEICTRGIHRCCRPNCGDLHAAKTCPKR